MKKLFLILAFSCLCELSYSQTWIWYPGDYEIWLGNRMNNRRTDRGAFFPPFWKSDSHYVTVEFSKILDLKEPETVKIDVEGMYNIKIDGKMLFGMPDVFTLSAGKHHLNVKVWNQTTPPAIFVNGKTIKSDDTWKVTNEDKEWIDASGKASDTSASVYMDAGSWNFDTPEQRPSLFHLNCQPQDVLSAKKTSQGGVLYDFGKETFGYLVFHDLSGKGNIRVYYGESAEEAQDKEHCETLDEFMASPQRMVDLSNHRDLKKEGSAFATSDSKAFRYVYVESDPTVHFQSMSMLYEYAQETDRASFECNDDEINRMWKIGEYTLRLTTREFFIDGIKRDRWTWGGDACQSYQMNDYLFFDSDCVKRTTWLLRGKDPVTSHINTIMDYTFYWFLGIYDYYMYSGDQHFVSQIYPQMKTLMDYVLSRTDKNGMVEGLSGDWVFVDWSPKPMDKHGELSFEQILFCKSLEDMSLCAGLTHHPAEQQKYEQLAEQLRGRILSTFWDNDRHAFVHNVIPSEENSTLLTRPITRYANIFAILFGYLNQQQKEEVAKGVLFNDKIMPITTPYMRFYEMDALCKMGKQREVLGQMKNYWGGMMRHGCTTFWESYDPSLDKGKLAPLSGHLSMYGRPYGKSLCHAWGASPIYLLGKYFLGVVPSEAGYKEYQVTPVLGGLKWMKGSVPTPHGEVNVYMDRHQVKVKSTEGTGWLNLPGKSPVKIPAGQEITVRY